MDYFFLGALIRNLLKFNRINLIHFLLLMLVNAIVHIVLDYLSHLLIGVAVFWFLLGLALVVIQHVEAG